MRYFSALLLFVTLLSACDKAPSIPENVTDMTGTEENSYGLNNDNLAKLSELKVMTYNIHACNPPSQPGLCDVNAVAEAIISADPDIVLLQEVDKNTGRNGYRGDQSAELGKLTNMNSRYYSATIYREGYYGIAILSKYPLHNTRKYLLAKKTGLEQRVLGTAVVDLPGIDSVMIACTHLQHNDADNRLDQVKDVVKFMSKTKMPVIIGGDFNERPSATEFFSVFDAAFTRTCSGPGCPYTFSTINAYAEIDYLAFKPQTAFEVTSHQRVNEIYASDHFPVMAILKFNR